VNEKGLSRAIDQAFPAPLIRFSLNSGDSIPNTVRSVLSERDYRVRSFILNPGVKNQRPDPEARIPPNAQNETQLKQNYLELKSF
jgi:hypothetical protein